MFDYDFLVLKCYFFRDLLLSR